MTENELLENVTLENFPKICKALTSKIFNDSKQEKDQKLFEKNISKFEQIMLTELAISMFVSIPKSDLTNTAHRAGLYLADIFKHLQEKKDNFKFILDAEMKAIKDQPLN